MKKYLYKNNTKNDVTVVGVGVIEAGKTLETEQLIENPNITLVDTKSAKKTVNKDEGDVE
ncbi:hypothetical protein GBP62_25150 [Mycobacterium avium subsp. hominissuis]|uniref:hypothetical protein n=1 Tax=Mycobacterium avium TaxID=1764 RepID=UPI001CC3C48B|nr:hypothetical protein [Mycobacterium avium]MBZ4533128.1 hypothetical protein [Mycobacterium avium subsp. hominissuis]